MDMVRLVAMIEHLITVELGRIIGFMNIISGLQNENISIKLGNVLLFVRR